MSMTDGLLLAAAGIVAVRTLVSMMRQRSQRLVEEVQKQVDAHREHEKRRKERERRKQMKDAA